MKETVNKLLVFLLLLFPVFAFAQLKPVHTFWKDDSVVKKTYYDQALKQKNDLITALSKDEKKDYKSVYENRFEEVGGLITGTRSVTEPETHQYLQSILKKIVDANPELKPLQLRVFFTRDWWPNAYSMGEGTIGFNAGLFVYLNNESEIAFVLCHELAHLYLDHSGKRIDKLVQLRNSDSLKKEIKRLSKLQYKVAEEYNKLAKYLAFDIKRHSREGEEEADRVGLRFLKNTGYTGTGFISTMKVLDNIDDTALFDPLKLEKILSFPDYPFRERWIKKETSIFGAMQAEEASELTKRELDSLKTHPDCSKRIALLQDSALNVQGKEFLVDQQLFNKLKENFIPEMLEELYRNGNVSFNLYVSLQLLQEGKFTPLAIYSIARDLNRIYKSQQNHELGLIIATEHSRFEEGYNLLLRMLYKLKLSEIAELNDRFCSFYKDQMKEYKGFAEEMHIAQKNKLNHQ